MFKIATTNILFEMNCWEERREILVEGLKSVDADLIALQEINIEHNTGDWLAEKLNMPYVYLVPYVEKPYNTGPNYGIAIISRYHFIKQEKLDLQSQGRFAQYVQVEIDNQPLIFCNGHYYWQPGATPARMQQFQLLVDWLGKLPKELPIIAVGDFNATPDTPEILFLRDNFTSAYAAYHGCEPEYTCPTPLVKKKRSIQHRLKLKIFDALVNRTLQPWRGTLDYIFINQHLSISDCQLILTEPAPDNPNIYPSDHFGITAKLTFKLDNIT
jgi:endonuclease/exonuclease/phosphatase family metal-dependent hydrolase